MSLPQPRKVRAIQYGDYIKISWEGDVDPNILGYKIYTGDNPTPDWGNAIDNGLNDGDDGIEFKTYSVLVNVPSQVICRWETFETYPEGEVELLSDNIGDLWDGPWANTLTEIGYKGYGDDFESYSEGLHENLDGGTGFDGGWGVL